VDIQHSVFSWRRLGLLLLLPLIPAVAGMMWQGKPDTAREMTWEEAQALPKVQWVDARSRKEYEQGHKEGAVLLNAEEWDALLPGFLDSWEPGGTIVVYCASPSCGNSHEVARRLAEAMPEETILVVKGGWEAEKAAP